MSPLSPPPFLPPAYSGKGLTCRVGKFQVAIGNLLWMKEVGVAPLSDSSLQVAKHEESLGKVVVYMAVDGVIRGVFVITDAARPEAAHVIKALFKRGLQVRRVVLVKRRRGEGSSSSING